MCALSTLRAMRALSALVCALSTLRAMRALTAPLSPADNGGSCPPALSFVSLIKWACRLLHRQAHRQIRYWCALVCIRDLALLVLAGTSAEARNCTVLVAPHPPYWRRMPHLLKLMEWALDY